MEAYCSTSLQFSYQLPEEQEEDLKNSEFGKSSRRVSEGKAGKRKTSYAKVHSVIYFAYHWKVNGRKPGMRKRREHIFVSRRFEVNFHSLGACTGKFEKRAVLTGILRIRIKS